MARPKLYKDKEDAYKAQLARNRRYIDQKTDEIRANLPKGYKEKLEYIAQRLNTSKAGVLKTLIEREFERLKDE